MAVGSTQPTGAQKHDDGKPAMELIDAEAMEDLARVLEFGRRKYGAHNWRGGIGIGRLSAISDDRWKATNEPREAKHYE